MVQHLNMNDKYLMNLLTIV